MRAGIPRLSLRRYYTRGFLEMQCAIYIRPLMPLARYWRRAAGTHTLRYILLHAISEMRRHFVPAAPPAGMAASATNYYYH